MKTVFIGCRLTLDERTKFDSIWKLKGKRNRSHCLEELIKDYIKNNIMLGVKK